MRTPFSRKRLKKSLLILTIVFAGLGGIFLVLDLIFPFKPNITYSQIILDRNGQVQHAYLSKDQKWRLYAENDEISNLLLKTILFKEDKHFYKHPGINPVSIVRSFLKNLINKEIISGASTIDMQVARMLEPKPRTYKAKLIEMFRALQLEFHYSKKEILRMYLNKIPYGGNIEGIKAAALFYFNQKPQNLSLSQIVVLSIIPNNPNNLQPGKNDLVLHKMRDHWLDYFQDQNLFSDEMIADAKNEPLTAHRHNAPQNLPHLSWYLKRKYPNQRSIKTYIDQEIQQKTEKLTYNYVSQLKSKGIYNASVLLIDNETHQVITYIGSNDFKDQDNHGEVNGVEAIRSPGSTLKPILYALAFDKGLYTPKMKINDIPVSFGGYEPDNYSGHYLGQVRIEEALAKSLNIPAVKILEEIGTDTFINYLQKFSFSQIQNDHDKLGLSMILGGCGVKLSELCQLFSTFANGGNFSPILYCNADNRKAHQPLISPASSYMITKILTLLNRPDLPDIYTEAARLPKISWKTGTSYGRRDAWAIGYNKKYTLGVWIGNFNGKGVPELNGSEFAVPLLFMIFNQILPPNPSPFIQPDDLSTRMVCEESGLPPNTFCNNLIEDFYIQGISPSKKCNHLIPVYTNTEKTISYCTDCMPEGGTTKSLYPNYPPDLILFFEQNEIPYTKIPPHNVNCSRVFSSNTLKIISPQPNLEYLVFKNEGSQILLQAECSADVRKLYWFINDKFYKSAGIHDKVFFNPPKGKVKISCSDDKGRNTDIYITVNFI